jgi:hypothetical protein
MLLSLPLSHSFLSTFSMHYIIFLILHCFYFFRWRFNRSKLWTHSKQSTISNKSSSSSQITRSRPCQSLRHRPISTPSTFRFQNQSHSRSTKPTTLRSSKSTILCSLMGRTKRRRLLSTHPNRSNCCW